MKFWERGVRPLPQTRMAHPADQSRQRSGSDASFSQFRIRKPKAEMYSYIEVDATPAGQGTTNLTFRVQPHFFFSTFRLEPANLLERSLSGYFRLPLGEKFTTSAVDRTIEDATELLKSEGYFEV